MDKDATTNRNLVTSYISIVNGWRRSNHKFGVGIVPVDGELRVGLLAKEAFERTGQKNRSLNFIDDKHLYDDRDLPEVEVLPPDDDVRSNKTFLKCMH
jgi:hypothetical protein